MGETTKAVCRRDQWLVQRPDGEFYCRPKIREGGPRGNPCEKGYVETESENGKRYCAPCQEIAYSCSETGATIQTRDVCPGGVYYYTNNTKEEVFALAKKEVKDLIEKKCSIKTPGYFYDNFPVWLKEWKEAQARKDLEALLRAYAAKGLKEKTTPVGIQVEKKIKVLVPESTVERGMEPDPVYLPISRYREKPIVGKGKNGVEAKENWIQNAVQTLLASNDQLLPP